MSTKGGYVGGQYGYSTDGGANWLSAAAWDMAFREGRDVYHEQLTVSDSYAAVYGQNWVCQTFRPATDHYFDYVSLNLRKYGIAAYNVTIALYNVDPGNHQPTGAALRSTSFYAFPLSYYPKWYTYWFTPGYQLSAGTEYALVIYGSRGTINNRITVSSDSTGGYSRGQRGDSSNGGSSWQIEHWPGPGLQRRTSTLA